MKICLINNLYKPYNRGGADKIAENIVNGLEKAGYEIFVISTKPLFSHLASRVSYHNYYIPSIFPYLNKIPKPVRLLWHFGDNFNFINYLKIKKILKKEKCDLIITHNLKGLGCLIPKAIKKLKIKHVHYLHDIQLIHPSGLMFYGEEKKIDSIFAKIYSHITKKLFNSPNIIISPSKWLLNMHKKRNFFPNSKKIVLPNPATIHKMRDTRCKIQNTKLLYVGEIENHKGVMTLIQAFQKLNRDDVELIMIGQGSQLEKIKKISNKNKNIKILGWQKNEKVRKIMLNSDALIMPSSCYENSPTVIYEAISDGLPVIASEIGGIPELIKKFGGILFEPQNKNDLKNKINYLIDNYQEVKKASQKGKLEIKKLSLKNYTKELLDIIA